MQDFGGLYHEHINNLMNSLLQKINELVVDRVKFLIGGDTIDAIKTDAAIICYRHMFDHLAKMVNVTIPSDVYYMQKSAASLKNPNRAQA